MTTTPHDLYRRLRDFPIDDGTPDLPFEARLARENGWAPGYARRVVAEYRRFVFLAATSAEPVCPSEAVDAAWHLHLTYTRSYWTRLCAEVLGRPLHHDPTKGGTAEAGRHLRMYARTLAAYREAFGEDPPADVWPPAGRRFGDDLKHRVVNTSRNWVIPKRPVTRTVRLGAGCAAAAVLVPGCAGGGWNPFDLVGAEFLAVLIPVMVAAVLAGRVVRWAKRTPGPRPGDDELEPTWEEAAYLGGGYPRLTAAAIARLVEGGAAVVTGNRTRLDRGASLPARSGAVEAAVYQRLPFGNAAVQLAGVQQAVRWAFADEADRLEREGFTLTLGQQFGVVCAAAVPVALAVLTLGVPRLVMGVVNGKPIEYLVVTMMFGGFVCLIASVVGPLRRTRRGDAAVARFRARHAGAASGAVPDAGLTVALFGTAALVGPALADLRAWYPRQTTENSSGGCGTSSGGGEGGGCGGGGGGGGGGGCGGCGGG